MLLRARRCPPPCACPQEHLFEELEALLTRALEEGPGREQAASLRLMSRKVRVCTPPPPPCCAAASRSVPSPSATEPYPCLVVCAFPLPAPPAQQVEEIHTTLRKHLRKEEEQLLPLLLRHFSHSEQAELVAQFLCSIPLSTVEVCLCGGGEAGGSRGGGGVGARKCCC